MSDSREDSPDWLRCFQRPTQAAIQLSSGSESPLDHSPSRDDDDNINLSKLFKKGSSPALDAKDADDSQDSIVNRTVKGKSPKKNEKVKQTPGRKRKNEEGLEGGGKKPKGKDAKRKTAEKTGKDREQNHSIWSLSSDSESSPDIRAAKKEKAIKKDISSAKEDQVVENKDVDDIIFDNDGEFQKKIPSKVKSSLKKLENEVQNTLGEDEVNNNDAKEEISGKHPGPQHVSSSRMPLLLAEKVQRSKTLVEGEGDSIDLSGDVGSVGRVVISEDPLKNQEMFLDLKGTIYKTTIVPSRTFCVVSFGQSEAKIEAVMNEYIQLKPQSNVYEAETMVEGTLDGFSFDSEEEADNLPKTIAQVDEDEADKEQPNGKTKRKAQKISVAAKKKGKQVAAKQAKKVKRKPPVPKKSKTKK